MRDKYPIPEEDYEYSDSEHEEELLPEEFPPGTVIQQPYADLYDDDEEEYPSLPLDPIVALVVLIIVALLGAGALRPDVRFTILWTTLAVIAVIALLVDDIEVERPRLRDLLLGIGYGAMIGLPILTVVSAQLKSISLSLFGEGNHAFVFQTVMFTIPFAETLFFRAVFQGTRGLLFAAGGAALWTILLFFPALNILQYPLVALVLAVALVFVNFVYSYLCERFGLYAAWMCQVTINIALLFLSRLT
ncbi:MAG: hypothetical protein KF726_08970 [Anaerolineae bacterium]|nr:hypothetical protein [Anaerolineae bacterium]